MKRLFHKNKRSETATPTATPPGDGQYAPVANSSTSPPPHLAAAQYQGQGQQHAQPQSGQGFVPVQGSGGGVPRPPRVQDVGNAVGWSVAMPAFDWAYLLALSDHLSTSSSASKDATKALIAEFKHATPHAQQRAVHLTSLLWTQDSNDRFKEQVASKKFLASLTDLVGDQSTPPQVKSMVYRVLSPLAFDAQSKSSLRPITEAFNRLLADPKTSLSSFPNELDPTTAAFQPNGAPLAPDDPLLRPEALLSQHGSSRRSRPRMERFPTGIEQMRDLGRRAVEGKSWAGMLSEAVALAKDEPNARNKGRGKKWEDMDTEEKEAAQAMGEGPGGSEGGDGHEVEVREGLEANEVVQEFHTRCLEAQDFLSTNLDWASVQAEQSRQKADAEAASAPAPVAQPPVDAGEAQHLASNNPFAAVVAGHEVPGTKAGATEEEEILSEMLGAMTEISDALHLYALRLSHSRQTQQEDAELAAAIDRSRSDDHFNRFTHDEPEVDHAHGEGGSRAPARDPFGDADGFGDAQPAQHDKGKARESLNPYSSYLSSAASHPSPAPAEYEQPQSSSPQAQPQSQAPPTSAASPYDGLEALEGLGGLSFSSPSSGAAAEQYDDFLSPARPSSGGFSSSNPYASYSSQPASNGGYAVPDSAPAAHRDGLRDRSDSAFLREYVPEQPSQKALGKIRRVSQGAADDQSPEERQLQLEAALRDKYERNYREEQERRERGHE
ncbi:uncharacterized protein RHOBADRAFT_56178 [Rhodotorula graminis WP1]|uniref:VHS domain-containing protein n=1 Tax=Rhodotorula graminis (strain WP1) TaxID=578459 RepID=A0A0N8PZD8_RHOGW|nr:uncharacterized protein RHOBADRAFT_56178 [Rhodotorula graminis WP1]KPV72045.1 hypothetical protein RHOBADRAFT_56178 [Rhodotorula graminis WP1]